ncbi:MAG: alpha/beta hydrolase fold domain-containing protein [Cumulibacter sp.]
MWRCTIDLSVGVGSYLTRADDDPIVSLTIARRYADAYLDGAGPTEPRASPVFADLSGLPPMHVQVGADVVLLNDSILIARGGGERRSGRLAAWATCTAILRIAVARGAPRTRVGCSLCT